MTDRGAAPARSARRPALSQTILSVAAVAVAVATLIWSALFYDATRKHAAVAATPTQPAPAATGTSQQAPGAAPVTTRTS